MFGESIFVIVTQKYLLGKFYACGTPVPGSLQMSNDPLEMFRKISPNVPDGYTKKKTSQNKIKFYIYNS